MGRKLIPPLPSCQTIFAYRHRFEEETYSNGIVSLYKKKCSCYDYLQGRREGVPGPKRGPDSKLLQIYNYCEI